MTTHNRTMLGGGLLLLILAGSSSDSLALPFDMIRPGLACKWYGTVGNDTYLNPAGFSANGIMNTSSSDKYIACPIFKEPGADTGSAWALLNTGWASCEVWTRGFSFSGHWTPEPGSVTEVESGYWKHFFPGTFATSSYSVSILCLLPPSGAIIQYGHTSG